MEKIKVLLADDYTFLREGLQALLQLEGDITVVGAAENGRQAVELAGELLPDVVIMDTVMPGLTGPEATRQIKALLPETKVLALSSFSDDIYIRQMLEAGALSYVLKQGGCAEIIKAIREAKKGRAFFSPAIAGRPVVTQRGKFLNAASHPRTDRLSPRELEVLGLIADGYASKEIAAELCVSDGTVIKQRQQVMNKLNLHNIAALTRYAISEGLVQPTSLRDQTPAPAQSLGISRFDEGMEQDNFPIPLIVPALNARNRKIQPMYALAVLDLPAA